MKGRWIRWLALAIVGGSIILIAAITLVVVSNMVGLFADASNNAGTSNNQAPRWLFGVTAAAAAAFAALGIAVAYRLRKRRAENPTAPTPDQAATFAAAQAAAQAAADAEATAPQGSMGTPLSPESPGLQPKSIL